MKDEEMAEEIANKRCHEIVCYGHCSFNSPKHHRCGEWHREYNCALEGLKAGRQDDQLTKAKESIKDLYYIIQSRIDYKDNISLNDAMERAKQSLKEIEK